MGEEGGREREFMVIKCPYLMLSMLVRTSLVPVGGGYGQLCSDVGLLLFVGLYGVLPHGTKTRNIIMPPRDSIYMGETLIQSGLHMYRHMTRGSDPLP